MKKFALPFLALSLLLAACQTTVLKEEEKQPPAGSLIPFSGRPVTMNKAQSVLSFVGKSNIVNHECKFNDFDVTITPDSAEPANFEKASVAVTIAIGSLATDSEKLTGHMMKDDFFAAEQFPQATFVSKQIVKKGDHSYDVTGDLTLKGTTKEAVLNVIVTDDYLMAHYDLPRRDFGIGNDTYGQKLLDLLVPVDAKVAFGR